MNVNVFNWGGTISVGASRVRGMIVTREKTKVIVLYNSGVGKKEIFLCNIQKLIQHVPQVSTPILLNPWMCSGKIVTRE